MIMGHCSCCAHTHECAPEKHIEKKESIFAEYWKVGLSFILLISGIIMNALELPFFREGYFSLIWYVVAYLPVGLPVMKEAWESMKDKDYFSEFTLMFVATLGAFYIGEYPEGVAVMLFYSVGELFQEKAVDKAKRNIGALLDVRPEEAAVVRDERVVIENPQSVKVGETIEIKTGGRVPLDGMMLNEVAAFNTAALTGESVPRSIRMGEEVLAGMIVTDKVIRIKVIRPFDKSALARILELVQNASERKAPAELFIRKFARVYTPIVIGLAVLIVLLPFIYSLITPQFLFTFNDWLYRALVFLVISCPCALVVSIPLGYFGGCRAKFGTRKCDRDRSRFDFTTGKKTKDGYTKITPADRYSEEKGYGYDRQPSPEGKSTAPFFFSVTVPDGNYHVTAVIGNKRAAGETTVRGESRRLFFENVKTKKGELKSCTFVINKRNTHISEKENVRIKPRERQKLNWDDKLTLEFNGDAPQLSELIIEKVNNVPTVFLCGNSTVVDQIGRAHV